MDMSSSCTIGIVTVICSQIIKTVEAANVHDHEEHLNPSRPAIMIFTTLQFVSNNIFIRTQIFKKTLMMQNNIKYLDKLSQIFR